MVTAGGGGLAEERAGVLSVRVSGRRGAILTPMMQAALRWIVPLFALLVAGPVAGYLTGMLRDPCGGEHASLLVSTTPALGVAAGIGAVVVAGLMGVVASKLINSHYGFFSAGLTLAWAAWGTGTIDELVRCVPGRGVFVKLAIEGLIVLLPACVFAWLIVRVSRPAPAGSRAHPEPKAIKEPAAAIGALAAIVAGGVIAWLVAQTSLKGQTVAAAALAGLVAASVARLAAPGVNAAVFVGALALLGVVSPASALVLHGGDGAGGAAVVNATQAGTLFSLARVMPLDWIAGAFIGLPIGLTWAGGMIDHHQPRAGK